MGSRAAGSVDRCHNAPVRACLWNGSGYWVSMLCVVCVLRGIVSHGTLDLLRDSQVDVVQGESLLPPAIQFVDSLGYHNKHSRLLRLLRNEGEERHE